MKMCSIYVLVIFSVIIGTTVASNDKKTAISKDETTTAADTGNELLCAVHGQNFNGKKTCEIACRAGCLQPGCSGYRECKQVPNPGEEDPRLHKYKCLCNEA